MGDRTKVYSADSLDSKGGEEGPAGAGAMGAGGEEEGKESADKPGYADDQPEEQLTTSTLERSVSKLPSSAKAFGGLTGTHLSAARKIFERCVRGGRERERERERARAPQEDDRDTAAGARETAAPWRGRRARALGCSLR